MFIQHSYACPGPHILQPPPWEEAQSRCSSTVSDRAGSEEEERGTSTPQPIDFNAPPKLTAARPFNWPTAPPTADAGMPIWTQMDSLCDKAACPVAPGPTQVREGGAGAGAEAEAEAACLRRRMGGALGWRVPA